MEMSTKKSKKNKVLVNFIQDRSGSMQSVWEETLSGFKKFIEELKAEREVEYLFSLTTFDTQVETPIIAAKIETIDADTLKAYGPRGSTALYDAVGTTIKNTDDNRHGADKIICVIVTDGQENSSREWDKDKLQKAIESHLKAGDWTLTYLGTQPETWDDAGAIGVSAGSTVSYTPAMAAMAYTATGQSVNCLSKSRFMGTRNFASDYMDDAVVASAGMNKAGWGGVSKKTVPPKSVTPPSIKPTKTARRWK
jgi:hypothetical protein